MDISASARVNGIKGKTGLGMMLCKKALIESNGDMALAIEGLRKQGQAAVAKRRRSRSRESSIVADASCGNSL